MYLVTHPEVLADDWLPPLPLGRSAETRDVVRRLDPPLPRAPPPWVVAVAGPSGAGTSTVARRAARDVAELLRADRSGPAARVLAVRTALLRGTHGVAAALLQKLDDGFDGRGFPTAEILAGFLRRVRRLARPVVVVLDDVALAGPDLSPVLRAIAAPDRFLPEGEHGLPPLWTILAGTPEGLAGGLANVPAAVPLRPFVSLAPYDGPTLGAIVRDRAARTLGAPPPETLLASVVARAVADGGGASRALDLLRRELLGADAFPSRRTAARAAGVVVERHVVDAIGQASRAAPARLAEVRRWEERLARQSGRTPLPTTTFWRRIVRLEQAGYVRREIRTGGPGGTLSVVRLLTPVEEWVTAARAETRPAAAAGPSASAAGWASESPPAALGADR